MSPVPVTSPRLEAELRRLYGPVADHGVAEAALLRCMVVAAPAPQWRDLARLWQAVQDDLGWPAPAIAADGEARLALWFSLADPHAAVDLQRMARALLQPLQTADPSTSPTRTWQVWPTPGATPSLPPCPPQAIAPERWSAFVAPDLAPMFADSAWLDIPPSPEGQADLLTPLRSVTATQLQALALATTAPPDDPTPQHTPAPQAPASNGLTLGPRAFLQHVMNDPATPLRWRIEAAKALLPHQPD